MGRRLRIGLVSTYPPTHCGVAEYTRFLVNALFSVCPDVEITVFCDENRLRGEGLREGVVSAFTRGKPEFNGLLDGLAEVDGVDVIHVQHEYGIYTEKGAILKALRQAKKERLTRAVVITMHTVCHPLSNRKGAVKLQGKLEEYVDAIVVHSELQEYELQIQGVNPAKISRIPHGTLINPYLDLPRESLLKILGLREGERRITLVTPGFIRPDKGLDILLRASELTGVRGGFRLVVAGEATDPKAEKLVREGVERGELAWINRYLSSKELLALMALADAIVLPYKDVRGSLSVSGILHMSMGSMKPIIGSRTPRLVELYKHAPRLTVRPLSPEELALKLRWLLENYDYAVAYTAPVYAYAARTQWPRMARRHLELYRVLLTEEKPILP